MAQISVRACNAIKRLSPYSGVASLVCSAVADGRLQGTLNVRRLCTLCGIAQSRSGEVSAFLECAQTLEVVQRVSELNWRITDVATMAELSPMFQAIQIYVNQVHRDENTVEVVLTKPPSPSALTTALEKMLLGTWGLLETRDILPAIAEKAKARFVVMTPFLDEYGGEVLLNLYRNVGSHIKKQLIIRASPGGQLPEGYLAVAKELADLGIDVYNFRLERPEEVGTETFHAKVVLADHSSAYVGSSNMNKWSFQYSLELGLMVAGKAAVRVGHIIDAILKVSARV